jgi:hypothetical protein
MATARTRLSPKALREHPKAMSHTTTFSSDVGQIQRPELRTEAMASMTPVAISHLRLGRRSVRVDPAVLSGRPEVGGRTWSPRRSS